jgi:hypothetical protein
MATRQSIATTATKSPSMPAGAGRQTARRGLRATLASLEVFVAATAIVGAVFVVPTIPQEWLRKGLITPFSDTTVPALALGVLCGGSALVAALCAIVRPRLGALLAVVSGVMMVGFELVEILVVGFTPVMYPTQPPAWLQPIYMLLGVAIALLGARLWRAETGSYRINLSAL